MKFLFTILLFLFFISTAICQTPKAISFAEWERLPNKPVFSDSTFQSPPPAAPRRRQKLDWSKGHPRLNKALHWGSLAFDVAFTFGDGYESDQIINHQLTRDGVPVRFGESVGLFKGKDGLIFETKKFALVNSLQIGGAEALEGYAAEPADIWKIFWGSVGMYNFFHGRSIARGTRVGARR